MRRLLILLASLMVLAGGAVAATVLRSRSNPFPSEPKAPQTSVVGNATSDHRSPAGLELVWATPQEVSSGEVQGRVTAIPESAGILDSGSPVIEVDGIVRLALVAQRPLWRPLQWSVSGPDVVEVAQFLVVLDYLGSSDHTSIGPVMSGAVRDFEGDHGWEQTGVFKPEYVIWLPPESLSPLVPLVEVNEPVETDTPLFRERPRLVSADVVPVEVGTPLDVPPDGKIVFDILGGPTVGIGRDVLAVDDSALPRVASYASQLRDDATQADDILRGVLRLEEPEEIQTVPSAAIILGTSGATCVQLVSGEIVSVQVEGGRGGVTEIVPVLDPDAEISVNPDPSLSRSCR